MLVLEISFAYTQPARKGSGRGSLVMATAVFPVSTQKTKEAIADQDDSQNDLGGLVEGNLIGGGQQDIDADSRIYKRHEKIKIPQQFLRRRFCRPLIWVSDHLSKA
jgi:hypothetical protein